MNLASLSSDHGVCGYSGGSLAALSAARVAADGGAAPSNCDQSMRLIGPGPPPCRTQCQVLATIGPAHVVGWSYGANTGLIAAMRRPDLVRKLVLIGTAMNIGSGRPWARAMMDQFSVDHLPPALVEAYAALSPDGPDHFSVVFDKIAPALLVTEAKLSDLAAITTPTLIMAGDDDLVAVEHLEAMRTTLPDGQPAIVPGTSHGLPLEKPELVSRLIFDFLSVEQAEKFMPGPK